jgi:drug/metabolite transporter (DMT)-like permease
LVSLLATFNVTLFSFGIRLTSTTVAQTLYSSVPVFAAILSYLLLRQKLGAGKIFGILAGLAGTATIILPPALATNTRLHSNFLGNSIIFIAMMSFSLYTVISKKLQYLASPLVITSVFMFTTAISQFIPAIFETSYYPSWWANVSLPSLLSLLYVSVIGTVIYYFLYQYAIKHANPLTASLTFYLQPAATYLLANILLKEKIEQIFLVGAGLIFIGTWLVVKQNQPAGKINYQNARTDNK